MAMIHGLMTGLEASIVNSCCFAPNRFSSLLEAVKCSALLQAARRVVGLAAYTGTIL
jgi:hypothetical protein